MKMQPLIADEVLIESVVVKLTHKGQNVKIKNTLQDLDPFCN